MMQPLRHKVLSGERTFGAMVFEFTTHGMPQLLHLAGAEYIIYDMEHSGLSLETLRTQTALCRGLPITPIARPPSSSYDHIARLLDIGMRGIMVPMVETAAQAADIVAHSHYPPQGHRGAAFGFTHDDYQVGVPADTMRKANEETLVIAQIETAKGLENVDEIAAVSGIDVLWIGQFDLSSFLGIPGQFEHSDYIDACAAINAAARRHGKKMGIMAPNPDWAKGYAAEGYDMIASGPETSFVINGVKEILEAAK